jgi:diguanylate cyclase (GGDEF)-like protein
MLQRLLSTDSLTGIANRRHFDHTLAREWRRCARAGAPLSLLMLDVDYFKAYNDSLGHQRGDDCLRQVAALLTLVARRPGDLAARYGGEEFACLLPATDNTGALAVAELLKDRIDKAKIPHPDSPLGEMLTISIGVATARPPAESREWLVESADRLLYEAKKAGRNRMVSARSVRPQQPFEVIGHAPGGPERALAG